MSEQKPTSSNHPTPQTMSYPPCPPLPKMPVPQSCAPPPPAPACRVKPIMKGLHMAQTKRVLAQALLLSAIGGACVYLFVGRPRMQAYQHFYEKGEFEDWADEMARKGLFQSVPKDSLQDNKHMDKK